MNDDSGAIKRMKKLTATQFWQAAQAGNLAIDAVLMDIKDLVLLAERTETAEAELVRLKALASPPLSQPRAEVIDNAWRELCEKDDRNSPVEYPDHALITQEELADFMSRAALSSTSGAMEPSDEYKEALRHVEGGE